MSEINKKSIGLCIILSFVTFGIYSYYWMYLLVKNTHLIQKNDRSCAGEMFCLLFVPFYSLYWWYTRGKQLKQEFAKYDHNANGNETTYLILAFCGLSFVAMLIMQQDFNSLELETDLRQQKYTKNKRQRTYDLYVVRWFFRILIFISISLGVLFFYYNHLEFIINATEQNKFHLSNGAYAILRPISCLILPMLFLFPSFFNYGRMRCVKYAYIIYGFLHILTTCWVVTFLMNMGNGYNILRYDHILAYQSTMTNAYVSSPVFWDTYNLMGVLFSWTFGALCIYTGLSFDENKKKVRLLVLAVLLFKVLAPMANNLIFGKQIISRYWIDHNLTDTFSLIFYTAAIWVASLTDHAWVDLVWDQEPSMQEMDED